MFVKATTWIPSNCDTSPSFLLLQQPCSGSRSDSRRESTELDLTGVEVWPDTYNEGEAADLQLYARVMIAKRSGEFKLS